MMMNPYTKKRRPNPKVSQEEATVVDPCISEISGSKGPDSQVPTTESASALVIAATDKAGMDGIDRATIDKIILRESGSTFYMQQQRKRDQQVNERIEQIREKLKKEEEKNPAWRPALQRSVDKELSEAVKKRPVRSTCVVVDMDMFFMACELLTRPDLADKPACVGGSMITTSNYVARRYGVRSAMAGWIGDKLVEELSGGKETLIHLDSNFELYKEKSAIVKQVLAEYDPMLSMHSLDEAFLDLAPYLALRMTKKWTHHQIREELLKQSTRAQKRKSSQSDHAWSESLCLLSSFPSRLCRQHVAEVMEDMREKVHHETGGLTCSAGLAPNFLLAKIASDRNKPNGQCLVDPDHDSVTQFLHPLPTRKICGIGRVTEKTLQAFGIKTVQDLNRERALVRLLFKPVSAGFLLRASAGCASSDDRTVDDSNVHGQKGISRERSFQARDSWTEINSTLEDIARLLSTDMKKKNLWAHTITVKVKLHTFDVFSRARSMPHSVYLHDAEDLVLHATELLREIRNTMKNAAQFSVRLLGIRCSNFRGEENAGQVNIDQFLEPRTVSPISGRTREQGTAASTLDSKHTGEKNEKGVHESGFAGQAQESPDISFVYCPICQAGFPADKNFELNRHIDACLSGRVVRRVLREQDDESRTKKPHRKRRITDFY